MIKLELQPKPSELTDELQAAKTQEFKKDKDKAVWKIGWLQKAVSDMSFGKCCFSEVMLKEEGKYPEIEHYHPKSLYPDKVMEWGNLILCGGVCNKSKLNHDTLKYPVINPFRDNPNDFLYFENYRYKEKNKMGHDTIDILDLNNWEYFIKPRAKIGNKVQETLSELRESLDDLTDDRKRRRFIRKFKNLLSEGGRKEPYSALISTIILSDSNFEKIKNTISVNKLWDQDLEDLKDDLKYCALLK